ncbi:MAG: thiolase domain-containing protein [Thermoplasmata archaeon]|nr:thiolase domain-containing protein [Thermoplasmata archaeon]
MKNVYVAGVGMTNFGKSERLGRELALEAAISAIEDAGIEPKDIDATYVSSAFGIGENQVHVGPLINSALGIPDRPSLTIESACSGSSAAFHEAYVALSSGFYNIALVVGYEKLTMNSTPENTRLFAMASDFWYEGLNGVTFPGLYALMATAHMNKYGTSEEMLGSIAIKNHRNGFYNPKAHFRKIIDMDTYLKSPVVAYPLKLYDSCPFSDGAAAIILINEDAKIKKSELVKVLASVRSGSMAALQDRNDYTGIPGAKIASEKAYKYSKTSPEMISFAEVHDCFTIAEVMAMEDIGFFKKGDGGKASLEGITQFDGKKPVNPSGGLKAKGHPVSATGIAQIVEIYDQMLFRVDKNRQVSNPEIGLTHNVGATGGSVTINIFRRLK